MQQFPSFRNTRQIGPSQLSFNIQNTDVDDITPRDNDQNYGKNIAKKATDAARRRRRQVFYSVLCLTAAVLAVGLAAAIAYTVIQRMNGSKDISCNPTCMNNGTCVSNNVCQCPSTYSGSNCANPICNQSCANGNCTAPNFCTCAPGYYGATCATPNCSANCVNGTCSAPNTCTCQTGWSGAMCSTPTCASPCINGVCSNPNTCTCNSGWNGSTCNSPICSPVCQNNGSCTAPNICTCASGYNGSLCQFPICSTDCLNNGTCTAPNTCTCLPGYNGSICQYPICTPTCLNGGICTAINTCSCTQDVWTGPICQTPIRILWGFDNTLQDLYNNYQGVGINGPTYRSPGINGYGTCLYLNASSSQSVTIYSPPFLNMAQTSFSLLAWVKATSFGGMSPDNAVFGQFQNNTADRSLHIIVRNQKIYLGFFNDDIQGTVTLYPGNWYHMAYIYDYSSFTQYVYINGVLDVSGSPKGPYLGTTGDLTIGTNGVFAGVNFWDGCIDQVAYFARAKSATEVLHDATLTVDYTFDNNLIDNGPLGINGTGMTFTYSSGRINQSVSLSGSRSYVQATGLVLLGTPGQAYSFSIWIKPLVTKNATIIHVSGLPNGLNWCIPMLGFTSGGAISALGWNSTGITIIGPTITANVWTHVAVTYSSTTGLRLWISGNQYGSASGGYMYAALNAPVTVTLGSSLNGTNICASGAITMGQYNGYMDAFQLYSRELSSSEITNLANP